AGQLEQLGDVRHVGGADLREVGLAVVVGRGQAEAALAGVGDLAAGILEVAVAVEAERHRVALRVAVADVGGDAGAVLEAGDARQHRLDRRVAGLVDRRLVHARGVQPADLLLDRAGLGLRDVLGRLLNDRVLDVQAVLAQRVERAPARAVGGNWVRGHPFRVDEAVEVLAGVDLGVQLADVERGGGRGERARGERQGDGQCQRLRVTVAHADDPRSVAVPRDARVKEFAKPQARANPRAGHSDLGHGCAGAWPRRWSGRQPRRRASTIRACPNLPTPFSARPPLPTSPPSWPWSNPPTAAIPAGAAGPPNPTCWTASAPTSPASRRCWTSPTAWCCWPSATACCWPVATSSGTATPVTSACSRSTPHSRAAASARPRWLRPSASRASRGSAARCT